MDKSSTTWIIETMCLSDIVFRLSKFIPYHFNCQFMSVLVTIDQSIQYGFFGAIKACWLDQSGDVEI